MSTGRVFYAVLDMGLGHATRSLPVIREFLNRGWEVLLGSNGRALYFLNEELPEIEFTVTPGYGVKYTKGGWLLPKLALQFPGIMQKIREEQQFLQETVRKFSPDIIVSDHCYGMYHSHIPSYFISHQISFAMPRGMESLSPVAARFNSSFHKKYRKVLIPDLPGKYGGLLSGKLSRFPDKNEHYFYCGGLSSIQEKAAPRKLDLLISISGPEPQRTLFEKRILEQLPGIPGKKVVVLGKSEKVELVEELPDLKIYTHVPRQELEKLFNQAEMIVSRPGYSTIMELAELGKRALLVPTPGQTEQRYLARFSRKNLWYHSVSQHALNLTRDLPLAQKYAGLYKPHMTEHALKTIFQLLF